MHTEKMILVMNTSRVVQWGKPGNQNLGRQKIWFSCMVIASQYQWPIRSELYGPRSNNQIFFGPRTYSDAQKTSKKSWPKQFICMIHLLRNYLSIMHAWSWIAMSIILVACYISSVENVYNTFTLHMTVRGIPLSELNYCSGIPFTWILTVLL